MDGAERRIVGTLWLAAERRSIVRRIAEISENGESADSGLFRNFLEPEDGEKTGRRLYSAWNFPKATNAAAVLPV